MTTCSKMQYVSKVSVLVAQTTGHAAGQQMKTENGQCKKACSVRKLTCPGGLCELLRPFLSSSALGSCLSSSLPAPSEAAACSGSSCLLPDWAPRSEASFLWATAQGRHSSAPATAEAAAYGAAVSRACSQPDSGCCETHCKACKVSSSATQAKTSCSCTASHVPLRIACIHTSNVDLAPHSRSEQL